MAYLITQILLCLALAALVGGVAGWLINGYRAAKNEQKIKTELMRQSLALNQAETDNKMIEDDFRDLKYRSEEAITLLKEETRQIPVLHQNLEKSQTLVRQLLQKHEAEKRHVVSENEILATKVRELEGREKAVTKLQMDLNTERLQLKSKDTAAADQPEESEHSDTPLTAKGQETDITTRSVATGAKQSEMSLDTSEPDSVGETPDKESANRPSKVFAISVNNESADHDAEVLPEPSNDDTQVEEIVEFDNEELQAAAASIETAEQLASEEEETEKPAEPVDEPVTRTPRDFGVVKHTDDLKKIFGIGPVTIKTLNALGIKNYDQIARFDRDDIEYIADELQIFPGRIERDNWVGSAKKLLAEQQARMAEDTEQLEDA